MLRITKRGVQIILGILWLLDGMLQFQHQMFTSSFATQVITPAMQEQPGFVTWPMHLGVKIFLMHPAVFNLLFALTQLGLGVLILSKSTVKLGLMLSLPWALIVWMFGEGYGGIFSAHTLLLMGAPGAVIIYAVLALAAMPSHYQKKSRKNDQVAYWLAIVWLILWVGGGVYQLMPGQDSTSFVSSMISANAKVAPHWLASIDIRTAKVIQDFGKNDKPTVPKQNINAMYMTNAQMTHMTSELVTSPRSNQGYLFILVLAILQFCIGFGVLIPGTWRKLAISIGILLSFTFWFVGQSLGGYFTGLATDPNTGPLIIILGLAILGCANLDQKLSRLGDKIESIMTGKPIHKISHEGIDPSA
jgi:hypothetical protein